MACTEISSIPLTDKLSFIRSDTRAWEQHHSEQHAGGVYPTAYGCRTQLDDNFKGVVSCEFQTDNTEAEYIVKRINMLHERGVEYKDIAILVRSRTVMPTLNKVLGQSKLPVNDTTKFADFMKSEVVADVMNFLKVFTNHETCMRLWRHWTNQNEVSVQ